MKKEIVCIICPRGCRIKVTGQDEQIEKIENYSCNRGIDYARSEFICPCRILTSSIPAEGAQDRRRLPIRSSAPIPRDKILLCMEQIRSVKAPSTVKMHQVIIENILGTGIDIISCRPVY